MASRRVVTLEFKMGVPKLWAELQPYGHDVAIARLAEAIADRGASRKKSLDSKTLIRLGIDIAGWLFHAQKAQGGKAPILRSLFYRMCRLLNLPHILPVFVFDGPARPSMKRGQYVRATNNSDGDDVYIEGAGRRLIPDVKQLIESFGFAWIDAPGEAEAELADLNRRGLLDAIMTDDVDAFVFGASFVVRFWGQELSSIKARSNFLLGQAGAARDETAGPTASSSDGSSDSESSSSQKGKAGEDTMTESQRKALQDNSVTCFTAGEVETQTGLDIGGFVLVAILSGGDYDVQGLARCGIKIAIALARAGYGKELYDGARKHLKAPNASREPASKGSRPPSPEPQSGWADFLQNWRDRLCQELASNKTGYLGRKFKKLSESVEVRELLSTPAALAVLATYVWPVVSKRQEPIEAGVLDLARLAANIQDRFGWATAWTMESMRSKVWTGCAMRLMLGHHIANLTLDDLKQAMSPPQISRSSPAKSTMKKGANNAKISSFFSSAKVQVGTESTSSDSEYSVHHSSAFVGSAHILGERKHATTGFMSELRITIGVARMADVARKALKEDEEQTDQRSEASSSQSSPRRTPSKSSPSKTRTLHFTDASLPVRFWASKDIVLCAPNAKGAYADYVKQRDEKAKKKSGSQSRQASAKKLQTKPNGLQSFFPASRPPGRDRAPPSSTGDLLSAIAAVSRGEVFPKKCPPLQLSPSKRSAGKGSAKKVIPPSGAAGNEDGSGSSLSSPSPPPSPTMARRRAKRHSARSDLATERLILEKQSLPYDKTLSGIAPAPTATQVAGDESVEIVSVRKQDSANHKSGEPVGSVTISDDSDDD